MAKIRTGTKAPDFALSDTDDKRISLRAALARGPVVAAFFKISCPTSQFTLPFLERLYKAYGSNGAAFLGISQDDVQDTRDFCTEYGITFPVLIEEEGFPVSNEYGITNVPTFYLIAPDGTVKVDSVGFGKRALEEISDELARLSGCPTAPVFQPGEIVPETKPG